MAGDFTGMYVGDVYGWWPSNARPCPSCGYCPTCGRRGAAPHGAWPYWPHDTITWTTTGAPVCEHEQVKATWQSP